MPRGKNLPSDHTEFGGGSGLIDDVRRADRVVGQDATATGYTVMNESLMEIYATNPADAKSVPETSDLTASPWPNPAEWDDPSTAKGTS